MPDVVLPLVLAKLSGPAVATAFAGPASQPQNVLGTALQPCVHEGGSTGYFRDNLCHAPGDPNHHEVCAQITRDFWPESGQGEMGIFGKWCICVHKLGEWLRGATAHHGISGIDCSATSIEALRGDTDAAQYIAQHCPGAVAEASAEPLIWSTLLTTSESDGRLPKAVDDFL
mmetsp:Transcript_30754/g.49500  ORF Transcript_30754/g.49500 Transcript_30754/m.49500 type:complete len:172 (-) Transcript_30754:158-673(-)